MGQYWIYGAYDCRAKQDIVNNKVINRTIIIFILAIIPPSLGMFSFYRYEDFYHMAYMKIHLPDFSWQSFQNIPNLRLYEYYRPVLTFFYWLGYLLSHNNPTILHALASLSFGVMTVLIYVIARFFSGDLSGVLAAVIFATFGPLVAVSWWTGTFAVLPGFILFLTGIIFFLYLERHVNLYTTIALFLFASSFFNKESFIILSPILLLFCLFSPKFRTRHHFIVALGVIPFALAKVYISNVIMGATVNSHVHFNVLEVDHLVIWTNLYSYWQLLVYGHNYWFVLLALLSISPKIFQDERKTWMFIPLVCAVVFTLRVLHQTWAIDLILMVLSVIYLWYCTFYERIWAAWIVLGLSQLVFWDISIIGGIMNRLIIEPSVGFALFIGMGLSRQINFIRSLGFSLKQPLQWLHDSRHALLKSVTCLSIISGCIIGIGEEVFVLGGRQLQRDMIMWYNQGAVLEDIIDYIVEEVPSDATLIISEPPLEGMQVTDQLGDALFMLARPDISISYDDTASHMKPHTYIHPHTPLRQALKRMTEGQPVFLISTNPLDIKRVEDEHAVHYRLSFQSVHDQFDGYIYELKPLSQAP